MINIIMTFQIIKIPKLKLKLYAKNVKPYLNKKSINI